MPSKNQWEARTSPRPDKTVIVNDLVKSIDANDGPIIVNDDIAMGSQASVAAVASIASVASTASAGSTASVAVYYGRVSRAAISSAGSVAGAASIGSVASIASQASLASLSSIASQGSAAGTSIASRAARASAGSLASVAGSVYLDWCAASVAEPTDIVKTGSTANVTIRPNGSETINNVSRYDHTVQFTPFTLISDNSELFGNS